MNPRIVLARWASLLVVVVLLCTSIGAEEHTTQVSPVAVEKPVRSDRRGWGSWSGWSACSRTCGRGVSSQTRECLPVPRKPRRRLRHDKRRRRPGRKGKGRCLGVYKRFQLCHPQDCPRPVDMRKEQCSVLDRKSYRGRYFRWEPYLSGENCRLHCRPVEHPFLGHLVKMADDGTPCSTHPTEDKVCLASRCRAVGCDGLVGSEQRLDQCGVCGGDNSTCRVVSGLFTRSILPVGYNLIARIPRGACNINITEIRQSGNYLALRTDGGAFVVNGNWVLNWSGEFRAAGTVFSYRRHRPGDHVGEGIAAAGPTAQHVDLLVVYQYPNLGIKYEYTLLHPETSSVRVDPSPNAAGNALPAPAPDPPHAGPSLRQGQTTNSLEEVPASGFRTQNVDASRGWRSARHRSAPPLRRTSSGGEAASERLRKNFNGQAPGTEVAQGPFRWRITGLTECSLTCGGGVQKTIVVCVAEATLVAVPDVHCRRQPRPEVQTVSCNAQPCPAGWESDEWSLCGVPCGEGVESRTVACRQQISNTLKVTVAEAACYGKERPPDRRPCLRGACAHWREGDWGSCSAECGKGVRWRKVQCFADVPLPDDRCPGSKPDDEATCDMGPCITTWVFSNWTDRCSSECGEGVRTRKVACLHGRGGRTVGDGCDASSRPPEEQQCIGNKGCGGNWFLGPWSECSATCGSGSQVREVLCMRNFSHRWNVVEDEECIEQDRPESRRHCNPDPCGAEWFTTQWIQCSRSCNTGVQTREVMCLDRESRPSSNCSENGKPPARQACQTQECPTTGKDSGCVDRFRNCNLVVQARLCSYDYYRNNCCDSCFSAG